MTKKNLLLLIAFIFCINSQAQLRDATLMTINGNPVSKSEFEYIYHKNNTDVQKTTDEYLNLFIDYKLKIEEAKSLKIDTIQAFEKELAEYKEQLIASFLNDSIYNEIIAKKIYQRQSENIELSHILFLFPQQNLFPADTLEIYKKALSVREQILQKGVDSFTQFAKEFSEDPSAKQSQTPGYLGWSTSLMFIAPFENAMYATKPNEISMPVRTIYGYHLIKVLDRRPDIGDSSISHIMFSFPQKDPTSQQVDSVKRQADEVYNKLKTGSDFIELCKQYTSDKGSANNGGSLGWLNIRSRFPEVFMNAALSIKNIGEYTNPIMTDYGFHIIKLDAKKGRASWEESKSQIINQIQNSDFSREISALKLKDLGVEFSLKINDAAINKAQLLAKNIFPTDSLFIDELNKIKINLFTIEGKAYSTKDFTTYLEQNKSQTSNLSTELLSYKLNDFALSLLEEKEEMCLDKKYPEFGNLAREYHDGILLFNIMTLKVWDKAANDEDGLRKYFDANKTKYAWDAPKYKGFVVQCSNKEAMLKAQNIIKNTENSDNIIEELKTAFDNDGKIIRVSKGLWSKGENQFVDYVAFNGEKPENLKDYPEHFVTGKIIDSPEDYNDVKGLIISDYQDVVEKEWVKYLRNKYTIKINEGVLESIKQ